MLWELCLGLVYDRPRLVASLGGDKKLAAAIAARDNVPAELQPFLATALNS